jgi:hypothetical protein
MLAESKKTGRQVEFTLEQWRNMENTGHAKNWRIIDAGIIPKIEQIVKPFGIEPKTIDVEYHISYRKLLDEAGIKYNKNIKNELKLKEIYEQNKQL